MIEDYSPTGSVKDSLISLPERVFLRVIPGYLFSLVRSLTAAVPIRFLFITATGRKVFASGFRSFGSLRNGYRL